MFSKYLLCGSRIGCIVRTSSTLGTGKLSEGGKGDFSVEVDEGRLGLDSIASGHAR